MLEYIGDSGPHPDLRSILIRDVERLHPARRLTLSPLSILKQRTLSGLSHPLDRDLNESISIVLAVSPAIPNLDDVDHLISFVARRVDGSDTWTQAGTLYKPIPRGIAKPWTGAVSIDAQQGLAVGAMVRHPDVDLQQIELPDGAVFEDHVSNGCVLIYAPLRTRARWSGEATLRMFTRDGRLIETASIPLNPAPLTQLRA